MTLGMTPRDADDVGEAVGWALAGGRRLEVVAGGTLAGIGRPVAADARLDMSRLAGVGLYEPDELVVAVGPATPLAELAGLLARHGQELAFEPPDFGPLFGGAAGRGSVGGIVAGNLSGPRRVKAGAARDHVLGLKAVSGRGEAFKAGGRVVKNVTGYDLARGITGSWGTLCVMTEVTLRVLPAAESEATLILAGLDAGRACAAMSAATGSPCEVSAAAFLPAAAAGRCGVAAVSGAGASVTALRLEGFAPSLAYRGERLAALLADCTVAGRLEAEDSRALWRAVRDAAPFADDPARPLWRLSVPPRAGGDVAEALVAACGGAFLLDWAGGLVWYAPEAGAGACAGEVRGALAAAGGHATLVRADAATRASVPVFEPQPAALAALTRRLKESFDPRGILNPGRMYPAGRD